MLYFVFHTSKSYINQGCKSFIGYRIMQAISTNLIRYLIIHLAQNKDQV